MNSEQFEQLLEVSLFAIDWKRVSKMTTDRAVNLIQNNLDLVDWRSLTKNEDNRIFDLLEKNLDEVHWDILAKNDNSRTYDLINANLDKLYIDEHNIECIDIWRLDFTKLDPHHISWKSLSMSHVDLLKRQFDFKLER